MVEIPSVPETAQVARGVFAPMAPEQFLADAYTQRALHLPAPAAGRFQELLSLDEIESHMRMPGFFETTSVSVREPDRYDAEPVSNPATVYERLSRGHGLQIVGVERALPNTHPLVRIFRSLEELCQAPAQAMTVFVTPPGVRLPPHRDPFEIFTLQLLGRKSWHLFGFHPPGPSDEALEVGDAAESVLVATPGDVLYVPKCLAHHVHTGDELSLSVAMVYDAPSWLAVLDALRAAVERDGDFWRSLPPADIEAGFPRRREALRAAVERLDADAFAKRATHQRRAAIPGLAAPHLAACLGIDQIGLGTRLRVRPGPAPLVAELDGRAILISAHDEPIAAPISALAAFRFVAAATAPFAAEDVSDTLSHASRLALVRKLARRGVLQIL